MQVTDYAETEQSKPGNEQSIELHKLITNPWQEACTEDTRKSQAESEGRHVNCLDFEYTLPHTNSSIKGENLRGLRELGHNIF